MKALSALTAIVALAGASFASAQTPLARAEKSISPERMKEYDRYISSDDFEGRYPGLRGGQLAADYIASQFALYGLKPAGDNGTFMQQVAFVGMKVKPESTSYELKSTKGEVLPLTFAKDYTVSNQTLTPEVSFDVPLVFVGFGVTAPEYHWDDYAGVDVKGKVIVCIVGDPPSKDPKFFGGDALTYYGRWTYKFEQAARMGAIGVLIIHRTDYASYGWDVVRNSNASERTYLRDDANPHLKAASWIHRDVARKLFAMSGLDLDKEMEAASKPGFKAMELPVKLKAKISSTVRPFESPNVVGMLPGANVAAHKPDQAVLYSAHYDHLGMKPDQPGDNIYNGAVDNGTGTALLLEMAHAWAQLAQTPGVVLPHSVIFGSVTAEEQGLLGSEYLGQHPPVPSAQLSLDINYDAIEPVGIQQEVNVNGAQRTTFYPQVEATAKRFGLAIVPDPTPSAGSYYRSDHFSLSRVGIPAFSVDAGSLYKGHDKAWGKAKDEDYNDHRYHNFSDNFDPTWDFTGNANLARFGMDLGWQVIHAPHTVEWKHGDEFEAARLASQKK